MHYKHLNYIYLLNTFSAKALILHINKLQKIITKINNDQVS
jgi:hypothetical protein